jgi:hypothetical protein
MKNQNRHIHFIFTKISIFKVIIMQNLSENLSKIWKNLDKSFPKI